ncbi:hypothetical protein DUD99_22870 [Salmonella enterica subsp. enterica]|nr:hypothetical protein [Salmonella enterica subsp. enterica]EAW1859404.1 hypothetical protein [Salmonella enterica subsp. enterica]
MTECFHCVAARVTVLSVLLFSAPVFAVTTCAYEGDLTYTYTLSGTSDNVQMSASEGMTGASHQRRDMPGITHGFCIPIPYRMGASA